MGKSICFSNLHNVEVFVHISNKYNRCAMFVTKRSSKRRFCSTNKKRKFEEIDVDKRYLKLVANFKLPFLHKKWRLYCENILYDEKIMMRI